MERPDIDRKSQPLQGPEFFRQSRLDKGHLMGNDQDHGKIATEHGATRILDITAEAVEYLSRIGHYAGAVLADDCNGEMCQAVFAAFAHENSFLTHKHAKKSFTNCFSPAFRGKYFSSQLIDEHFARPARAV
jgi:hypothetical protein